MIIERIRELPAFARALLIALFFYVISSSMFLIIASVMGIFDKVFFNLLIIFGTLSILVFIYAYIVFKSDE